MLTMDFLMMGGAIGKSESMPSPASVQPRHRSTDIETGPVVPFPAARRTAHVRQCAGELGGLHGEDARRYWLKVCRELADDLLKFGSSESQARSAVLAFQDEVQRELLRQHEAEQD